ncbi:MAG: hypothetical protein PHE47_02905 [Oscillospiraceae bacterium]|nr:hypothetical protein [Oscillospiraceae bacterium]
MEQDTVKMIKRTIGLTLALVVAAGVIGALLWFFGSPWGCSGAEKQIEAYVAQTYPDQSLTVEKAVYDLPSHGYRAQVEDTAQKDAFFTVLVKNGQILSDSYEADVENKGNTIRRLEETYEALVQERLEELELAAQVRAVVHLDSGAAPRVTLGMAFSLEDALPYSLMLEGTADAPTLDTAAALLGQVYGALDTAAYSFSSYGVQLGQDGAMIAVAQVLPSQIAGGNLARILQLALEGKTENGIYIRVRELAQNSEPESTSEKA